METLQTRPWWRLTQMHRGCTYIVLLGAGLVFRLDGPLSGPIMVHPLLERGCRLKRVSPSAMLR